MSEEEKKAINELKEEISKPLEVPEDIFDTYILFNIKNSKILLNLIDRLQKRINYLEDGLEEGKQIIGELRRLLDKEKEKK